METLDALPTTFVGLYESVNHLIDKLFEDDPNLAMAFCYDKIGENAKKSFFAMGLTKDPTGNSSLRRIHGKLNISNLDVNNLTKLFSTCPEVFSYNGKPAFHVSHPLSNDFNVALISTLIDFCKTNELEFILSPNSWIDSGKRLRLTVFRPEVLDAFNQIDPPRE